MSDEQKMYLFLAFLVVLIIVVVFSLFNMSWGNLQWQREMRADYIKGNKLNPAVYPKEQVAISIQSAWSARRWFGWTGLTLTSALGLGTLALAYLAYTFYS